MAEWVHTIIASNATVRYYETPVPDPKGVVTIYRREIMDSVPIVRQTVDISRRPIMDSMTLAVRTLTIRRRAIMDSIVLTK